MCSLWKMRLPPSKGLMKQPCTTRDRVEFRAEMCHLETSSAGVIPSRECGGMNRVDSGGRP